MRLISDAEIRRHVTFPVVLAAVERAFIALDRGESQIFDVVRGQGGGENHFFAVKSGRDGSIPAVGLKAGSYAPANHARGLPAHTSTTLLIDDLTGQPFAVVAADYLNGMRTAAANALAVRMLSNPNAATLGIVGIGAQAICEALAVAHVRPIRRILAVGESKERRAEFSAAIRAHLGFDVEYVDSHSAASNADVLVTVTPARAPLVKAQWVRAGTHVSAMGADDVGKQELEAELLARSEVWVDHPEQAARIGEVQHAIREGLLSHEAIRRRTLGALLRAGTARHDENVITVFDSSGLAIQDIAAAYAAFQAVSKASSGLS